MLSTDFVGIDHWRDDGAVQQWVLSRESCSGSQSLNKTVGVWPPENLVDDITLGCSPPQPDETTSRPRDTLTFINTAANELAQTNLHQLSNFTKS